MKERRSTWAISLHEAGHATVAAALGSRPHTVEAGRDGGRVQLTDEGAAGPPPPLPTARGNSLAIGLALQQTAIAMGGALAVALLALRAPTLRARGLDACARLSSVDAEMAERASVALEASGACPRRALTHAADLAIEILERHWAVVLTVAHALRRAGELGPDRLASLLGPVITDPGPRRRLLDAAEALVGGEQALPPPGRAGPEASRAASVTRPPGPRLDMPRVDSQKAVERPPPLGR